MSNSNDLFPDLRDSFVSAIAIRTGISSCLSISDTLTSLPALKAVTVDTNGVIDFNDRSALITDGQFLVQSLKHQGLRTFGEYADMYVGVVLRKGVRFRRIDVVFDRYRTQSIKSGTRKKKSKSV
jgi:hypothetical protein